MGSKSEMAAWLEQLGLGQYAESFALHEIDLSILPDLSDDDFAEIGVPLGPRRKIQKAFSKPSRQIPGDLPRDSAERRHLTVLFADIVGSSAMSMKMDPEELRELMRGFQDASKSAVDRFQGFVARFMGDGVLAYFGFPQSHEDDPERAVRAGLELIRLTASLDERLCAGKDVTLRVRVGIATGPVVVGDLIGEGASSESSVVGETPNIAAKIESSSPPGNVTVGEETLQLLGNRFEVEELPPLSLDSESKPIRMFRIVSERQVMTRFKAKRDGSGSIFVGRIAELALLRRGWDSVRESNGGAFLISGDAGVGKSRFLEEFLRRFESPDRTVIHFQCSPFHTNTAFHPIVERLAALTTIEKADTCETKRERLKNLVRDAPRPRSESIQLLAALMSVDIGETLPERLLDNPPLRLAETHEVLVEQVVARTDDGPVVVIFEDAHWMDPTTLDTAMQLGRACRKQKMMVVVTTRSDVGIEHVLRRTMQTIHLSGLGRKETEELVRNVHRGKRLSRSTIDTVVERTDGIPLFIEELTKLVLERSEQPSDSDTAIPTTLVDSLTERLDRLGSSKSVAQIGATIGREFSLEMLSLVDPRSEAELRGDLDRLIEAEMIQQTGTGPKPVYRFKHALVQDAAYGTLLYATRREHHARISDAILDAFPETAREKPEILGHHLSKAGRPLEAVDYWQAAGRNATNRSANAEAVNHLANGIATLQSLPNRASADLEKELELQIALGPPLVAARGYASSELEAAYTRALNIGEQLDTGISDFRVLWGLSSFFLLRGQLERSLDLQRKCVALAEREGNEDWSVLASSWLGTVLFYRNELEDAAAHLERAIECYRTESATQLGYQFGLDPAVLARVHLVWMHWLRGETDRAHAVDEETLTFAQGLDHPLSHVHALNFSVILQIFQGNYEKALSRADQVLSVSGEFEFPHYLAYAQITRGFAMAKLGSVEKGIDEMAEGLRARRETGAELVRPMFLTMLAEVLAASGQPDWAIDALDEADAIVAENGESWLEPETLRVRGLVLEQLAPDGKESIACIRRAIANAEASGAVSLEIRAILSLVELQNRHASQPGQTRNHLDRLEQLLQKLPPGIPSLDRQRSNELIQARDCR